MRFYIAALLSVLVCIPAAHAHQTDSVGPYRIQIGWMYEPAVSGEPNGIELFVSTLDPSLPPEDQPFADGISGLARDLKIQLVLKNVSTTLPIRADHNIAGKYFALVEPTVPGFYQVNILGNIADTTVSKSLHAPRVETKEYLQFPQLPQDPILQEHEDFRADLAGIRDSIARLESGQPVSYTGHLAIAGIGVGISAIILAAIAVARNKN